MTPLLPTFEILASSADQCSGGHCPTIYKKDDETYLIQGYCADDFFSEGFVPEGEAVVSIPASMVRGLLENLQNAKAE